MHSTLLSRLLKRWRIFSAAPPLHPSLSRSLFHDPSANQPVASSQEHRKPVIWAVPQAAAPQPAENGDPCSSLIPGYLIGDASSLESNAPGEHHLPIFVDMLQIKQLWWKYGEERLKKTELEMRMHDGLWSRKLVNRRDVVPSTIDLNYNGEITCVSFTMISNNMMRCPLVDHGDEKSHK